MTPFRALLAAAALLIGLPASLAAQQVSSMLARVQEDGAPVADVTLSVVADGTLRRVATTGTTGLAVVEFGRVPLDVGTRLSAWAVTCGDRREILFSGPGVARATPDDECRRTRLGAIVWYRTERLDVTLGESPRMTSRLATAVLRARYGFRAHAGPVVAFVSGSELDNTGVGFGGELVAGYDTEGGFGLGAGLALTRHGLDGLDEGLWRWAVTAEPRYTFSRPDWRARPYVAGRVAWQSLDSEAGSGLATETGWSYGAGGGVVFPFVAGTSLNFAAHAARLSVGADGLDRAGTLFTVGGAVQF